MSKGSQAGMDHGDRLPAREAADSVFSFVARRAEPVEDGVRWQTLTWENEPQYDVSVFYGVAGIPIFLADYASLTGSGRALELAIGGARWCDSPARVIAPEDEWHKDGLGRGRAGTGMAWLHVAAASGEREHLAAACAIGDALLAKAPGPVTDWLDGATGEAVFLLRLAEQSGDRRFLDGARRVAAWLADVAIDAPRGTYWPWQAGENEYASWYGLSFVPGSSGTGHMLLNLHDATGEAEWAALARRAGTLLASQAVRDRGGLNWPDTLDGLERGEPLRCQWCNGASGVGLFFVRAHEVLGAANGGGDAGGPDWLAVAEAAGEAAASYGDSRNNPCQCHGLAGSGELYLELYRATGRSLWLDRAQQTVDLAGRYRFRTPVGDDWQADDPGYCSPEFMLGASGTGHFFLRAWQRGALPRALV